MKNRLNWALIALFTVFFLLLFFAIAGARAQTTPILGGRMQSDLDAGGHLITNLHESFITLIGGARLEDETVTFQGEIEVLGNNILLGGGGARIIDGSFVGGEFPGMLSFEEMMLRFGAAGEHGTLAAGLGTNTWTLDRSLTLDGGLHASVIRSDAGGGGIDWTERTFRFGTNGSYGTLSGSADETSGWTLDRGLSLSGALAASNLVAKELSNTSTTLVFRTSYPGPGAPPRPIIFRPNAGTAETDSRRVIIDGVLSGENNEFDVVSGTNSASSILTIRGQGASGSSSFTGGHVRVRGGEGRQSATGGDVTISGGSVDQSANHAGNVLIQGGDSTNSISSKAGSVHIRAGRAAGSSITNGVLTIDFESVVIRSQAGDTNYIYVTSADGSTTGKVAIVWE